jgi:hypothetical protein
MPKVAFVPQGLLVILFSFCPLGGYLKRARATSFDSRHLLPDRYAP